MSKWIFIDEALPNKDESEYYLTLYLTHDTIGTWVNLWTGTDFEGDCSVDSVIAWAKIDFPPMPSDEEFCKHSNLITNKILKMLGRC